MKTSNKTENTLGCNHQFILSQIYQITKDTYSPTQALNERLAILIVYRSHLIK